MKISYREDMGEKAVPFDSYRGFQEITIPPEQRYVAVHEMQHAVVALALGIDVIEVSCEPGPGYRGITRFNPASVIGNEEALLAAVMASSIPIISEKGPSGLSGDKYQAYMLSLGDSGRRFAAQLQAGMILSSFGHDLLSECAKLLYEKGKAGKQELKDIIQTAQKKINSKRQLPFDIERLNEEEEHTHEFNIIIIEDNDGIPHVGKEYRCCKGINGHAYDCPNNTENKERKDKKKKDTNGEKSRSVTIFEEPSISDQSLNHILFEYEPKVYAN